MPTYTGGQAGVPVLLNLTDSEALEERLRTHLPCVLEAVRGDVLAFEVGWRPGSFPVFVRATVADLFDRVRRIWPEGAEFLGREKPGR